MDLTADQEWKKGSAELLVMSLLEDQPRHGYDISKMIEIRSGGALRFHVTSLYPLLHRLEKEGLGRGTMGGEAGTAPAEVLQPDPARQKGASVQAEELAGFRCGGGPGHGDGTCLIGKESLESGWRRCRSKPAPNRI